MAFEHVEIMIFEILKWNFITYDFNNALTIAAFNAMTHQILPQPELLL